MKWKKIKDGLPPEDKTADGIGTGKSKNVLVVFANHQYTPPVKLTRVAHYDFRLSKWKLPLNSLPETETVLGQSNEPIHWTDLPMELPFDNQLVLFRVKYIDKETLAVYNEQEDSFMLANPDGTLNEQVDFVFSQFIESWRPAQVLSI